jgi:hypothetical protein
VGKTAKLRLPPVTAVHIIGNMTFDDLADFISNQMRMSHVYQPVMLRELLRTGSTPERNIAIAILQRDERQIEYCEKVTRDMVGRVLRRHGLVERDRKSRNCRLKGFDSLTHDQIAHLSNLCDEKIEAFLKKLEVADKK